MALPFQRDEKGSLVIPLSQLQSGSLGELVKMDTDSIAHYAKRAPC